MASVVTGSGLSAEHLALREAVRRVVADRVAPAAAAVDRHHEFPEASLSALIAAGLHAVGVPEEYGGQGADHLAAVVVAEEVARGCATSQQVAGANELFMLPLLLAGSEEQRQRYLPSVADGSVLGAFALSEAEAGSDVGAISTRARRVDGGWELHGVKQWITNAGRAGAYVVVASSDPEAGGRGLSAFVVEPGDLGVSFGALERKMGMRGSPTADVILDRVRLPADRLIGDEGAGMRIAMLTLDRTRTTVAAQAVGIAQGALDVAVDYLGRRRQFGRPLADLQGLQFMIADMETQVRAARALTHEAARALDAGSPDAAIAGSVAKLFASDAAMKVTTDAVQLLGGAGYVEDFPVERMMRDAKVTQIYEGTNQIQRVVIARTLLSA